ncbi:hypothetical protein C0J45_1540, partial [Silurus meridionalis]
QLEEILHGGQLSCNHVDEVWPNLFLGDMYMSHDRYGLWRLGVTHVLNAAHGKMCCKGSDDFYGTTVKYYGVSANDLPTFDISPFFYPSAQFIHQALSTLRGKVLVHCIMGVSRSATLVLAYLMLHQRLTLRAAIQEVIQRRPIYPNRNFLGLLLELDTQLQRKRMIFTKKMKSTASKQSQIKNTQKQVQCDPDSEYITPELFELQKLFWQGTGTAYTHVSEVWPSVYIGDEKTALERHNLEKTGITHILNAAEGKWNNVATGPEYYKGMNISYYGVEAEDIPAFNLAQFFYPAAQFIDQALNNPECKLLVHCVMGRSRSATLFLAYLMIYKNMTVVDAIEHAKKQRCILPNRGFLKQLRELDIHLREQ